MGQVYKNKAPRWQTRGLCFLQLSPNILRTFVLLPDKNLVDIYVKLGNMRCEFRFQHCGRLRQGIIRIGQNYFSFIILNTSFHHIRNSIFHNPNSTERTYSQWIIALSLLQVVIRNLACCSAFILFRVRFQISTGRASRLASLFLFLRCHV